MARLNRINNFTEYLESCIALKSRYTIIIAFCGTTGQFLTAEHAALLRELGVSQDLSWDGVGKQDLAYVCILNNNHVLESISKDEGGGEAFLTQGIDSVEYSVASKTLNTGNRARIKIGINDYAVCARGFNAVVFDHLTQTLIDSVYFDTHLKHIPGAHLSYALDNAAEIVSAIHASGYSLAQYIRDNNLKNVTIFSEQQYLSMLKATIFQLDLLPNINVRYVAEDIFSVRIFDSNLFRNIHFANYIENKPSSKDTVIFYTRNVDNSVETYFRERAGRIIFFRDLLRELQYIAFRSRPLENFLLQHPDVTVVGFSTLIFPSSGAFPVRSRSVDEEKIIRNRITRDDFTNGLKSGEFIVASKAYQQYGYSAEDALKMQQIPKSYHNENGVKIFEDYASEFVNIRQGHRVTTSQPKEYSKTIYILGACAEFGIGSPDDKTIASFLQQSINELEQDSICVENYGIFLTNTQWAMSYTLNNLPIKPGDIVLLRDFYHIKKDDAVFPNYYTCDLSLRRPHVYGEVFTDNAHYSPNGSRAVADKLFSFLNQHNFFNDNAPPEAINKEKLHSQPGALYAIPDWANALYGNSGRAVVPFYKEELDDYKQHLRLMAPKIGAIVMNCNPFTLGHRYLIEYAIGQVTHLYVFVVEEDLSIFPFRDRFDLVKKCTSDLSKTTVLPSGKFIISSLTFTDYFNKSELQDRTIDPSQDVELFAKEIAPALGISVRFAGEEPIDNVTRQYNDTMRRILPQYGIEFIEIPRKKIAEGGGAISASQVRRLLEDRNFDAIAKLVPQATLEYLQQRE
jgi:[citrate (pro-3S)-lyase] ligase